MIESDPDIRTTRTSVRWTVRVGPSELELMSLTIEIDNTHIIIEYPRWGFLILIQKFHLSFFYLPRMATQLDFWKKNWSSNFFHRNQYRSPVQCDLSCAFISESHCFMTSGDFFQSRFGPFWQPSYRLFHSQALFLNVILFLKNEFLKKISKIFVRKFLFGNVR